MQVLLADKAGFCMGVRRAVDATLTLVDEGQEDLATLGPLIHNPQVLEELGNKGVEVLEQVPTEQKGIVIVRAHGIPPAAKEKLENSGARVLDATCPRVLKVQAIISRHSSEGAVTVIIGDKNHAEVVGLMGYAEAGVHVVSEEEDVKALMIDGPYIIVSQTTQDEPGFNRLSAMIMDRIPSGRVFNTICDSTAKRQEAVRKLSSEVDAMVVVGGRASANTARLAQVAAEMGCKVFLVETVREIRPEDFDGFDSVGVTAGASTPSWIINEVVTTLELL